MSGIVLRNISKHYRDADSNLAVISNLNYEFPASGTVAIVGKSGVGKSTLLHLVGGLDSPSTGSISVFGTDITRLGNKDLSLFRGKNIGFVFQFHHLLPEFTALENVAMPLIISGMAENDSMLAAKSVLERVGLSDRLNHRPSQLSGGEQQRVAIARAVVGKPRVVLADEPTGNLDHETALQIQALLRDIQRELNSLMIVVTHNGDLARSMDIMLEFLPGGQFRESGI